MDKRFISGLGLLLALWSSLPAQSDTITFLVPEHLAGSGDSLCLPVLGAQFEAVNFQFTLSWDASQLAYDGTYGYMPEGVMQFGNESLAMEQGLLTVVWNSFNSPLANVALPDSSLLFEVCFSSIAVGCDTAVGPIGFAAGPTPPFAYSLADGEFEQLHMRLVAGSLARACPALSAAGTANGQPWGAEGCAPFVVAFADASEAGSGNLSWLWHFGDGQSSQSPNPVHTYETPGTYEVLLIISDEYRSDTARLEIRVGALPVLERSFAFEVCEPNRIAFSASPDSSIASVSWSTGDGQEYDALAFEHTFGVFDTFYLALLSVVDANGCANSFSDTITVGPAYDLQASMDVLEAPAGSGSDGVLRFTASGGLPPYVYDWGHDGSLGDPVAEGLAEGLYSATLTDGNGCQKMDTVWVEVEGALFGTAAPPNVITPNGDGYNDFLIFEGLDAYPANTLKVFNRWGSVVYEALGYQNDWGGTYRGKLLPAGVYYYVLAVGQERTNIKSALTIIYE